MIDQVIRFVVCEVQSDCGYDTQRVRPRVQPRGQLLVLSRVVLVVELVYRASLPAVIFVGRVPGADLTLFRLGELEVEDGVTRVSERVGAGGIAFVTYAVQ